MALRYATRALLVAAVSVCLAGDLLAAPAPPIMAARRAAAAPSPGPAAPLSLQPLRGVREGTLAPREGGSILLQLESGKVPAGGHSVSFTSARPPAMPGLLARYRLALERESRRTLDRDSSLFWADSGDEEGNPLRRAQREARRIFQGANGRVLSQFAETLVEEAASLRAARDYVEGVRFDVTSGGKVRFRAGRDDSPSAGREDEGGSSREEVAASFGLIALGSPRLEVRTTLPGAIRSRIEVPLASPGLRATFSRRMTANLRGTMSLGVEDAGADRWLTAGLAVKF